jgi:hypothetical protein
MMTLDCVLPLFELEEAVFVGSGVKTNDLGGGEGEASDLVGEGMALGDGAEGLGEGARGSVVAGGGGSGDSDGIACEVCKTGGLAVGTDGTLLVVGAAGGFGPRTRTVSDIHVD